VNRDRAEVLVLFGVLIAILGTLQGLTGRSMLSRVSFGQPDSRRAGWMMAAVGAAALVVGVVVLSRTA
jgi:hypothetical protein